MQRVQGLKIATGLAAESSYNTASSTFLGWEQLNLDIISPDSNTENDSAWIGKGNEFAENIFPTYNDVQGTFEKYGSAEWMTYGLCYALGGVSYSSPTYTITPINPSTTLQLPSFSIGEQLPDGGGNAIDNLYTGCVMDSFQIDFKYGPGLKSVSTKGTFRGSGSVTSPSGVSYPAVESEHFTLGSGMSLVINGVDYVAASTGLEGSFSWNNNLVADLGYFIGSGVDAKGFATRANLLIGARKAAFSFTAFLTSTSAEYTKLRNLTTGTATMTFTYDGTHTVEIELQKVAFEKVENTNVDGIAAVRVSVLPMYDLTNGVVTVTAKCGITGIAG
jgi:hypothetical protein